MIDIETLLAYPVFAHMKPTVLARILRLNPTIEEGQLLRGLFRKPMSWRRVKKRLLRGECTPFGPYKTRGSGPKLRSGYYSRPIDLETAREIGWPV